MWTSCLQNVQVVLKFLVDLYKSDYEVAKAAVIEKGPKIVEIVLCGTSKIEKGQFNLTNLGTIHQIATKIPSILKVI